MPKKYALVIGNTEYADPNLAKLSAPGRDAEEFARVLQLAEMAAFDEVVTLVNENVPKLNEAIEDFFADKKPDDLLVFYFSGHGVRDDEGSLFLAVKSTRKARLHSTAITAEFIRKLMDKSRSTRQVIILDCCNSGAFPQGQTKGDAAMGMAGSLQGYGRVVLTATDKLQYAWEGDALLETDKSLFTHFLVKGLEGAADRDDDGKITVDELYDYAFEQVRKATPNQTPTKSASGQKGEIILREGIQKEVKPLALPAELLSAAENTVPYLREAAVKELEKLLNGKNAGMALSAGKELQRIITDEDTTPRVAKLAKQALENAGQAFQQTSEVLERERLERQYAKERDLAARSELERIPTPISQESFWSLLLPKLKIPALILLAGVVMFFLWRGISSLIAALPEATHTPQATLTLAPTKTKTPAPTKIMTPTPTLEPEPGATMTGKKGETLVYVPAGEFTMGNDDSDAPVHTVYLDAFWIDQFEVTNEMYAKCVADKDTPCAAPSNTDHFNNSSYAKHPVVYVNWEMAKTYCQWAGGDLPTEAQWEKAASWDEATQTQRVYPWGNDAPNKDLLNYNQNVGDTTEVGSYESGKSPYNAYDMAGNVWEWVNDRYDVYPNGDVKASSYFGQTYRVLRGGAWNFFDNDVRSANRLRYFPSDASSYFGFRCSRGTSP